MFIKPIEVSTLSIHPTSSWQDHAGNTHFVLQSKKKDSSIMRSLITGLSTGISLGVGAAVGGASALASSTGPGTSSSSDAVYRKSLLDYEYRILLRFNSRKADFIVAVDHSFDKIHTDWNWVERNLFIKLAEIDSTSLSSKLNTTADQIDKLLLVQFGEMTEEYKDPQVVGAMAKLQEVKSELIRVFPSAADDVLLNYYACTYWAAETISARGQIFVGRNNLYFSGTRQAGPADQDTSVPLSVSILIAYKDVNSLELVNAKRLLLPDSIQIGIKDKTFTFALYFHRKEIFRILTSLCNAAMNRLIKGAENSLSASSEMFSKNSANMTGDLAITSSNKSGGLLMGRSREVFGADDTLLLLGMGASTFQGIGDGDLGDMSQEQNTADYSAHDKSAQSISDTTQRPPSGPTPHTVLASSHTVVRYSHIKTALVNSLFDLDNQNKNMEFRNLFRLSYHETITMDESPCYYFHKPSSTSYTGSLYLSQNFANFAAQSSSPTPASTLSSVSSSSVSTSMLFDSSQDPNLVFVIPYPHIVSVKKQPATALPISGKLLSFSLSGYLVISTKTRGEFWLAFSTSKVRDRVSETLLSRIRTVDWRFDDDVVIGGRNSNSPINTTLSTGMSSGVLGMAGPALVDPLSSTKNTSHTPIFPLSNGSRSPNLVMPLGNTNDNGSTMYPLMTGLKFLVPQTDRGGRLSLQEDSPLYVARWTEYFDAYGRDVCIIKDMKAIRDLLISTDGIPERFRGDFWMLVSGAWYSKPESTYYQQLLSGNQHRVNPFAEEIEKDVHRSLPEHPAYQSPLGIDALRRLLTAFSWRNPAIGYAQALNIIAAVLLLHLREEDAFWMLCMIVERMLPDHYTKTLVGSVVDQAVFRQLVEIHLPALATHLDKLYMDLSMFSVPWFLCLYLNSVSQSVAIKLLDLFFLEGPKFLFWIAIAVLKINEAKLISKGKDDDIFVAILKDFFTRLGLPDSGRDSPVAGAAPDALPDISTATGRPLYELLVSTACTVLGPLITSESIEALRMRYRLKVVHQMEDNNRKSQVRTLCEQVTLSFEEVSAAYDDVRRLEFIHGEEEEDPTGSAAFLAEQGRAEEEEMRDILASLGGWGLVRRISRHHKQRNVTIVGCATSASGYGGISLASYSSVLPKTANDAESQVDISIKSICLYDFRKVFGTVSPWRCGKHEPLRIFKRNAHANPSGSIATAESEPVVVDGARLTEPANRSMGAGQSSMVGLETAASWSTITDATDLSLSLVDRIYFYCTFQYHYVQRQKRGQAELAAAGRLHSQSASDHSKSLGEIPEPGFVVDLAAMVHVLDAIMKQPLHSRLRFLFDLHDLDGDGFLNKVELKAVMDSFLEMFEHSRHDRAGLADTPLVKSASDKLSHSSAKDHGEAQDGKSKPRNKAEDEETYFRAVSSFLSAALQMGNNKGGALNVSNSGSTSSISGQGTKPLGNSSANVGADSLVSVSETPADTHGDGSGNVQGHSSEMTDSGFGRDPSSSNISQGGTSSLTSLALGDEATAAMTSIARNRKQKGAEIESAFLLSFNEFLLAVMSQSVFVQYFERTWSIHKEALGLVWIAWESKA
ncbi:hypothetical protein BASA61_005347 [Batrachochytrium salamandrivorans]|nr:hypothetical protein BASA60_005871 [Batrachochytrium salamandrivorans]KAH6577778.1 hypothetical protein BASA62_000759 [Batrachochytrium salamandrivorans]KAH6590308.1 hypothetical protein BASA61_005347 [Batrachochytrium salamandrivorans]